MAAPTVAIGDTDESVGREGQAMPIRPWLLSSAGDASAALSERALAGPRSTDVVVRALRAAGAVSIRTYLHAYHRLQIFGREHLPQAGSFVMVANHASHLDALCLLAALPLARLPRAYPAAAQEYFFVSLPRRAVAAIFTNAIPFGRQTHLKRSLVLCRQLLAHEGSILILFPEGTRSRTGALGDFRPGVGALLAGSGIPAVPCALEGAFDAWPRGRRLPRPSTLRLTIGTPRVYGDAPRNRESFHRIASELHDAVGGLSCA